MHVSQHLQQPIHRSLPLSALPYLPRGSLPQLQALADLKQAYSPYGQPNFAFIIAACVLSDPSLAAAHPVITRGLLSAVDIASSTM
jgi:hypothetical protein